MKDSEKDQKDVIEYMESRSIIRQLTAALSCSLATLVLGCLLGWPSPVLLKIRETGQPMELSNVEITWMISLLYFGNFVSPIGAGYMMDYVGRKTSLLLFSCFPMVSWVMIYFATNVDLLYSSRFLAGMWNGIVSTIVPTYMAEISEPGIRGALTVLCTLTVSIGMLSVFIVGQFVSYHTLALSFGAIPLFFVTTFVFMPESPFYLVMKNKKRAAAKALIWLRGRKDKRIQSELKHLVKTIRKEMKKGRSFRALFSRDNRKALVIVECLSVLQRLSGSSALIAYTSTTLPPEGAGSLDPNDCVIVMGCVWVVSIVISIVLIDRVGRKPLLISSSIGSGLAMFTAGLWYFLNDQTTVEVSEYYWIPFASLLLYGITFSVGYSPVVGTLQGELFSSNIKALACGFTAEVMSVTSFIVNVMIYPIKDEVGIFLNFFIFTIACFATTLFAMFFVIETKGKKLSEIHEDMG